MRHPLLASLTALSAWDFAGDMTWAGNFSATIEDTLEEPEGLVVIWDGERLSLGNASGNERVVSITLQGYDVEALHRLPLPGVHDAAHDPTAMDRTADGSLTIRQTLPPAPPPIGLEVPTSVVSFGR